MHKMFKINDLTGKCGDISQQASIFLPYAHKKLGFNKPVGVNFVSDPENAKDPFGKTAYYDPNKMEITVFVDKRHVKDILRSLSHELVHHAQCCRGEFDSGSHTGKGYAQKDPHMRKMEAEAYLLGSGLIFRDYEDKYMKNKKKSMVAEGYTPANYAEIGNQTTPVENFDHAFIMARQERVKKFRYIGEKDGKQVDGEFSSRLDTEETNPFEMEMEEPINIPEMTPLERREQEISTRATKDPLDDPPPPQSLYRENKENKMLKEEVLDLITEELYKVLKENEQVEERTKRDSPDRVAGRDAGGRRLKPLEEENLEEEELEEDVVEEETKECPKCGAMGCGCPPEEKAKKEEEVNENWYKGNKDQLLFERLLKKWAK